MYFALLFTPRTGSHLLRSYLDQHPEVDDIILENTTNIAIKSGVCLWPPTDKRIGKKFDISTLYEYNVLHKMKCPVIVTYRNNKLSQYISMALAHRDNRWGAFVSDKPRGLSRTKYNKNGVGHYEDEPIRIDIIDAIHTIKHWQTIEQYTKQEIPNALWIEYATLTIGDGIKQAQEWLGLSIVPLRRIMFKQSKGVNLDYIENINEVLNSELAGWV